MFTEIATYFSNKIEKYGIRAEGVDWNGTESQILRFEQLCKVFTVRDNFSVNDYGCGYGAFLDYIKDKFHITAYTGIDISKKMIEFATEIHKSIPYAQFFVGTSAPPPRHVADYGISSGIFNIRFNNSDEEWFQYIITTLEMLNKTSRLGFAFNCLTSYSDPEKMRSDLYYADPCQLFDFCKRKFTKNVALLHDYGLYDFTILVKKQI